jgi:hypothetical protein
MHVNDPPGRSRPPLQGPSVPASPTDAGGSSSAGSVRSEKTVHPTTHLGIQARRASTSPAALPRLQTQPDEATRASTPARRDGPSFGEALGARFTGAAPIQAVTAVVDLVCSLVASGAEGRSLAGGAAQALISTGLRLATDSVGHVAMTSATRTPPVRRFTDKIRGEAITKEETLSQIRAITAVMNTGGGTATQIGHSAAAAAMLRQELLPADLAAALLAGLASAGVISAGAVVLYNTNASFRDDVNKHLKSLKEAVVRILDQGGDSLPPSMRHADEMERGESPVELRRPLPGPAAP